MADERNHFDHRRLAKAKRELSGEKFIEFMRERFQHKS
jgi:hypothetical protein